MEERPSTFAPLKYGPYRSVWTANLVSNFGGLVQGVGAAWLMTSITTSDAMVAFVQASTSLPIMLFSLVAGAIADSYNRRQVMLAAQALMLVVSAALAVFAWLDWVTPWLLLAFTFLIGCGTALNNPSWQAAVGDMVPRKDLAAAVSLNAIGFNTMRSVGPAIGGLIVSAGGPAVAFAINALSYIAPIFAIRSWKLETPPNPLPRESLFSAIRAGLNYVAMSPTIGTVLLRSAMYGFGVIAILALLPLVARNLLGAGPFTYGAMLGFFGFGAICGGFLNAPLRAAMSSEAIVRVASLAFATSLTVLGLSGNVAISAVAMFGGGICWVLAFPLFNATVQLSAPRWVVGRALAIYQTAMFGGMAVGSWIWGVVAESYGLDIAFFCAAAALVIGAATGLLLPLPAASALNLDPVNRWKQPHLALDIKPRSGPIIVTVEYHIEQRDTPTFLDAMAERRRIRKRNGAQRWTLIRDMEHPEIWMESFQSPTWVEYLRHNSRVTHADAEVFDRIRALHTGAEPPKIRRMIERPTNWYAMIAHRDVLDMP